jgi:D-arginine dehydrogenase
LHTEEITRYSCGCQQKEDLMDQSYDIAIVGAGIAGASLAYALSGEASVVLLERESQPGYHSTGRSAATFMKTYGNADIRRLVTASAAFLETPPPGFCEGPILEPRGGLTIAAKEKQSLLEQEFARAQALVPEVCLLSPAEVQEKVPLLQEAAVAGGGILEPGAQDMDVARLHQGYLKAASAAGGVLYCDAEVISAERRGRHWHIETRRETVTASVLVNAAGAWADSFAGTLGLAPLGLVPKRRSAFTFRPPDNLDPSAWPLVIDVAESFYFKPDAGLLLGSPADETPAVPSDVRPEEIDLAIGAHRIEEATGHPITRIEHSWAGLRTFARDGTPVLGFDPREAGLFWLAGQGGYGIMTAPAMAEAAAALLCGRALPEALLEGGLSAESLSPARLA